MKLLFLIFSLVAVEVIALAAEAGCGKFLVVKGDIQVEFAKTKKVDKAKIGGEICAGDTVSAGADSRAKIVMVDNNELNVAPDSKIQIEAYDYKPDADKKKVLLNVLYGKVRSTVKQKYDDKAKDGQANTFQVKTKSAVAGVRGTDFLTSFSQQTGKSEVVTFSGKVDVGQPGPGGKISNPVSVGAGQKTEAAPGQAPAAPHAIPASELKEMNRESKADTATGSSSSSADTGGKKGDKADKDKSGDKDDKGDKSSDKGDKGDKGDKPADKQDKSADKSDKGDKSAADKSADKSDTKSADKSADTKSGDKPAGPTKTTTAVSTDTGTRSPASEPASGMNMDVSAAPPPPPPPPPPVMSVPLPPAIPAPPPVVYTPPPCTFCNQAITNGPAKVSITIIAK